MSHIEDLWTRPGPDGRERTDRWGTGKRWRARWVAPNGQEKSKTFTTKDAATLWLSKTTIDVASGAYIDPGAGNLTMHAWSQQWMATKRHRKPTTVAGYESLLRNQILPTWETTPVNRVHHADLQRWITDLTSSGLSPSRVRQAAAVMHQMLAFAVRAKLIPANPCQDLDLPRLPNSSRTYLTHEQVLAVANTCGQHKTLILLLAYTGLRWGEATALRVGDVDLERRRITVRQSVSHVGGHEVVGAPKSHRSREVPVPPQIDLEALLDERSDQALLFPDAQGGYLRGSNFLARVWYPALEEAGIPRMTLHELRHTAASLAIAAGADVKVVQRMLGHASGAMTLDVYGHLLDDRLDAVAQALGEQAAAAETAQRRHTGPGAVIQFPVRQRRSSP